MNKPLAVSTVVIISMIAVIVAFAVFSELEKKIDFPEEQLTQKNLEYEGLSEITDHKINQTSMSDGVNHVDTSGPDWECKKTLGLYELAKQDYGHFIENTKWLADKKCGFDVSNITP